MTTPLLAIAAALLACTGWFVERTARKLAEARARCEAAQAKRHLRERERELLVALFGARAQIATREGSALAGAKLLHTRQALAAVEATLDGDEQRARDLTLANEHLSNHIAALERERQALGSIGAALAEYTGTPN